MKSITLQNLALTQALFGHHNNNLDKICDVGRHKLVSKIISAYEKKQIRK